MAAGRTRPKVSQSMFENKPGAWSLIEEMNDRSKPSTSQIIPLTNNSSKGPRQERSISATVIREPAPGKDPGAKGR